ncbi:hypothetical protein DWZ63_11645 [Clostridium sp. AF34-13]|nr:hypothetical protein DWZ63_11645 [Clostridium sp. AF34-13]
MADFRFSSFTKGLNELCDWLAKYNSNDVCMESSGKISTGQYTRAQQSFLIVFFSSSANRICSRTELDSCTISFTVLL